MSNSKEKLEALIEKEHEKIKHADAIIASSIKKSEEELEVKLKPLRAIKKECRSEIRTIRRKLYAINKNIVYDADLLDAKEYVAELSDYHKRILSVRILRKLSEGISFRSVCINVDLKLLLDFCYEWIGNKASDNFVCVAMNLLVYRETRAFMAYTFGMNTMHLDDTMRSGLKELVEGARKEHGKAYPMPLL